MSHIAKRLLPALALFAGSAPAQEVFESHPLAPRSGPAGATLFTVIAPEASGVVTENAYADPEMWGRRSREFDLGGIGTGVAIGDYDNDGRPDIFVVSKTESCRLFRNQGDWTFEDVTGAAGVGDVGPAARVWKQGAAFADLNNDGWLDLYLCRFNAPNLLYINQRDGTFRESAAAAGLALATASVMAAFGDYDRDGWLDVFLQTNVMDATARPEGERDHLYRNNGDGTFTEVTDAAGVAPVPTHGNSALWWDYDHDGWPDLYVANDFAVPDALYRNNGDGTFTDVIARVAPSVPYSSMGSDLGDVDGDGRLDLLVADMAATDHVKDQRTMAETRARTRLPDTPGTVRQFPLSGLLLDTGTGRFLEVAQLAGVAATDWTWSPRFEDLDNDGHVDLHVTNGMYREIHNQDLIERRMSAGSPASGGQIVRASPVLAEANLAFRNLGNLEFHDVSVAWGLAERGVSFGSALGDLDGDGDLDLVYGNYQAGVTLLRNDCADGHRAVIALRGTRSNRHGIGATVRVEDSAGRRQVRVLMVARGFMSGSEAIAHFGLGEAPGIRRLEVTWPSGTVQVFESLPADHRFIVTEPAEPSDREPPSAAVVHTPFVEVSESSGLAWSAAEEPYDEFLDQRLLPMRLNRAGPAVAVGMLDGSGRDAIVFGGTTREPLRMLVADAPGHWIPRATNASTRAPDINDGPVLLFEANGDGFPDLLVTAGGVSAPEEDPVYQPRLYFNDGRGDFRPAPEDALPPFTVCVGAACAADFDGDGQLDLVLGGRATPGLYPTPPRSALLLNRGGRFIDATETHAPALRAIGMVTAATAADLDDDGRPDLLLALDWGTVRFLRNGGEAHFEDRSEAAGFAAAGPGWWRSLVAADFNRDGKPDVAAGNLGLNTPYRATPDQPVLLYAGDFSGRGSMELIEAYTQAGVVYPRRSRSDLGAAIPSVFRRFRSNNDYARASLADILGADKLAAATRLAATELRSGVFLSQPDGTFQFQAWPRLAQVAPANGMAAVDVDGDGRLDLLVAHNSHAPAPAIGRFDAGLGQFLRGDGRGAFTAVPTSESGFIVPGDARALAVLDIDEDGWPDVLVSRNDQAALAFRTRAAPGRRSIRVILQGRSSNPQAIGARVTAEYADGSRQRIEVCAGSGAFSQSTSAVFVGSTDEHRLLRVRIHWPSGATSTGPDWDAEIPANLCLTEPDV